MEISRRDLFRGGRDAGSVLAISRLLRELGLPPVADATAAEAGLSAGADVLPVDGRISGSDLESKTLLCVIPFVPTS
jgi:hypothetical protein